MKTDMVLLPDWDNTRLTDAMQRHNGYTLIKRQIAKALLERNRPLEGLMLNRIKTWRPQTNELLAAFDNIQLVKHVRGDEIETYVTTLNSL